jgi:hypothetical protein
LLTRAVLYRRPNVACFDLGITPNNFVNVVLMNILTVNFLFSTLVFWISAKIYIFPTGSRVFLLLRKRSRSDDIFRFDRRSPTQLSLTIQFAL